MTDNEIADVLGIEQPGVLSSKKFIKDLKKKALQLHEQVTPKNRQRRTTEYLQKFEKCAETEEEYCYVIEKETNERFYKDEESPAYVDLLEENEELEEKHKELKGELEKTKEYNAKLVDGLKNAKRRYGVAEKKWTALQKFSKHRVEIVERDNPTAPIYKTLPYYLKMKDGKKAVAKIICDTHGFHLEKINPKNVLFKEGDIMIGAHDFFHTKKKKHKLEPGQTVTINKSVDLAVVTKELVETERT
jgi:hypothetical protein